MLARTRSSAYALDDFPEDRFGCLPVRMGVEIEDDPMPEHGWRDRLYVVGAEMQPAAHDSVNPATLDKRLGSPRGTAVPNVFPSQFVRVWSAGLGGHNEVHRVILNVRRYQRVAANSPQSQNLL